MSLFDGCQCSWAGDESCYDAPGSAWYRVSVNSESETWRCIGCRGEWHRMVLVPAGVEFCAVDIEDEQEAA